MAARILVVEDEQAIQELVAVNLLRAGHQVRRADDAEAAQESLRQSLPDLVLIDWKLPGMQGVDLLRWLRSEPRTRAVAAIMLSSRAEERARIAGLDAGADDYVTKPFAVRELLARIAAVLRRRRPASDTAGAGSAGLQVDASLGRAHAGHAALAVTATELRLLHCLLAHPGRVHSRAHLLDLLRDEPARLQERSLDAHIRRLRTVLQPSGHAGCIQAVRGGGYRFAAELRQEGIGERRGGMRGPVP